MKLKDPDAVAFENTNDDSLDFFEAQTSREADFWNVLEGNAGHSSKGRKERSYEEEQEAHKRIRRDILGTIKKYIGALAGGKHFDSPSRYREGTIWEKIKFVIAFDATFRYLPDEHAGAENWDDYVEEDYLDAETGFRYDVEIACDKLALEGAACAKRIGSDTYGQWREAMIKLSDWDERVQCKAVDDIVNALELIWADLRTWIHLNDANSTAESKKKSRKSKK